MLFEFTSQPNWRLHKCCLRKPNIQYIIVVIQSFNKLFCIELKKWKVIMIKQTHTQNNLWFIQSSNNSNANSCWFCLFSFASLRSHICWQKFPHHLRTQGGYPDWCEWTNKRISNSNRSRTIFCLIEDNNFYGLNIYVISLCEFPPPRPISMFYE